MIKISKPYFVQEAAMVWEELLTELILKNLKKIQNGSLALVILLCCKATCFLIIKSLRCMRQWLLHLMMVKVTTLTFKACMMLYLDEKQTIQQRVPILIKREKHLALWWEEICRCCRTSWVLLQILKQKIKYYLLKMSENIF